MQAFRTDYPRAVYIRTIPVSVYVWDDPLLYPGMLYLEPLRKIVANAEAKRIIDIILVVWNKIEYNQAVDDGHTNGETKTVTRNRLTERRILMFHLMKHRILPASL